MQIQPTPSVATAPYGSADLRRYASKVQDMKHSSLGKIVQKKQQKNKEEQDISLSAQRNWQM